MYSGIPHRSWSESACIQALSAWKKEAIVCGKAMIEEAKGIAVKMAQAIFDEGQFQPRLMMPLSLSYDHRLIDGREAVTFLKRIVECVEDPERMLLEV